ncbi:MAG: dTDP-4-amino-4,6-dideoxygalactose transaminase [Acidobacteria bacterium]|nr:dTDP-4-amino-4,6-dideoxygalactose transaminase [Acidobacteriota bacterium]
MKIPFNKPYLTGNETKYISDSVASGKISGDGSFTKKCHEYFEKRYRFKKCLLTTSCTDALEMAAILLDIREGDEVICPSYTFVSTSNAFVLRGAKIIFADSEADSPNIDAEKIESLITPKTKAIVVVHYAGIACNMDKVMEIAAANDLFVVEDAAQAVDSFFRDRPLGSIGHLAAFSFHETKNIISGEGGMLVINDDRFAARAEIIREKGTNRSQFFRGEVDKYGWVDIGSSFLPSDIVAAFLYAQLENLDKIQDKRKALWNRYNEHLKPLEEARSLTLPRVPENATNNAHMFYIVCNTPDERAELIAMLKENDVQAVFHYLSLHKSEYYRGKYEGEELPNSDKYSDCLVRLPLFYELQEEQVDMIAGLITDFYEDRRRD